MSEYSKLLTDPTRVEIEAAVREAIERANQGLRARRVEMSPEWAAGRVVAAEDGGFEDDGGAVANAYRYAAYTAQVSCVWYTDPAGTKRVRVEGGRVRCNGRHVPSSLPGTAVNFADLPPIMTFHGVLYRFWCDRKRRKTDERGCLVRSAIAAANDPTAWLVLADWLDEHGAGADARAIRDTFAATGEWSPVPASV